jgi:hypothetical protein
MRSTLRATAGAFNQGFTHFFQSGGEPRCCSWRSGGDRPEAIFQRLFGVLHTLTAQ